MATATIKPGSRVQHVSNDSTTYRVVKVYDAGLVEVQRLKANGCDDHRCRPRLLGMEFLIVID